MGGTFAYKFITYILRYIFISKGHRDAIEHVISKRREKQVEIIDVGCVVVYCEIELAC